MSTPPKGSGPGLGADWFTSGYETPVEESTRKERVFRFWIPADKDGKTATEITFVDPAPLGMDFVVDGRKLRFPTLPVIYHEHQLKVDGDFRNWYTCHKTPRNDKCPLCADGDTPYQAAVLTVIDHSSYKDKKGKEWRDQKRLFVLKTSSSSYSFFKNFGDWLEEALKSAQARLAEVKDASKKVRAQSKVEEAEEELANYRKFGLRGCRFRVKRFGKLSPGVGENFEYLEREMLADDVEPFNYPVVLAPKSEEDSKKASAAASKSDGADAEAGDLPF